MKKQLILSFCIIALLGLLTACPVSSSYPLGKKGAIAIRQDLIGTWSTSAEDLEAKQVTIKKGTVANTYRVHVDEKGSMFMADGVDFIAWIAELKGKQFLVLQQLIDEMPIETYFVYHINVLNDKTLISNDISLNVNGVDAITSTDTYREEVSASMEKEAFLAEDINWSKIK